MANPASEASRSDSEYYRRLPPATQVRGSSTATSPSRSRMNHRRPTIERGTAEAAERRRKQPNKSSVAASPRQRSSPKSSVFPSHGDSRAFLPTLTRILESTSMDDSARRRYARSTSSGQPKRPRRVPSKYHSASDSGAPSKRLLQERMRALMSPSMQSVLSSLTAATGSSSGSNSTVTQDSYTRTGAPRQKMPINFPARSEVPLERTRRKHRARTEAAEEVDVFKFMEVEAPEPPSRPANNEAWQSSPAESSSSENDDGEEEEEDNDVDTDGSFSPHDQIPRDKPQYSPSALRKHHWRINQSPHSDSGISVRSSSMESSSRTSTGRSSSAEISGTPENGSGKAELPGPLPPLPSAMIEWRRRGSSSSSQGRHPHYSPHLPPPYPYGAMLPASPLHPPARRQSADSGASCEPPPGQSGYEVLASKLSTFDSCENDGALPPLYRRFEGLNHRIFLHLQDQISELEEQLAQLDQCIAKNAEAHGKSPASRRAEARYGGDLCYQRTEVLGQILNKITHYNQALASYNALLKDNHPASTADIARYQAFTAQAQPVVDTELRFLDAQADLLCFTRRAADPRARGARERDPASALESVSPTAAAAGLLAPLAAVLLALALFSCTPDARARAAILVVMTALGGAALFGSDLGRALRDQDRALGLMLYAGVLGALACAVGRHRN